MGRKKKEGEKRKRREIMRFIMEAKGGERDIFVCFIFL